MTRPDVEVPPELSALIRLAQLNVPTDVQELMTQGNPTAGVAPHVLRKIILAARAEQREEDARILLDYPPDEFFEVLDKIAARDDADDYVQRLEGDTGNWAYFMLKLLEPYAAAIRNEGK